MILQWYSNDTPTILPWYSNNTPMVLPWYFNDTPTVLPWYFNDTPKLQYSNDTSMVLPWYFNGTPMVLQRYSHGTPLILQLFFGVSEVSLFPPCIRPGSHYISNLKIELLKPMNINFLLVLSTPLFSDIFGKSSQWRAKTMYPYLIIHTERIRYWGEKNRV